MVLSGISTLVFFRQAGKKYEAIRSLYSFSVCHSLRKSGGGTKRYVTFIQLAYLLNSCSNMYACVCINLSIRYICADAIMESIGSIPYNH